MADVTDTYTYTGSEQTWTVPAGVESVVVACYGAQGGDYNGGGEGGEGGYATGTLAVTPGETLRIYVGGKGGTGSYAGTGTGGYNGGGTGGQLLYAGAGGGGASDVRQGGAALADRVIVAGGGGGMGSNTSTAGGNGGGTTGAGGGGSQYGGGGTQSSGGAAGGGNATAGASGVGGDGSDSGSEGGGGGGGGYYGGGGAGAISTGGGGGGGSGYVGGVTSSSMSSGVRTGDGYVQITYSDNTAPNAPTNLSPATGAALDRTSTQRFAWDFDDPDAGDAQSAYELRHRPVGSSTWSTVSGTVSEFHDFAGGTFAEGDHEWQVRTTDNAGAVGPWSTVETFTAATPPSAPSISSPANGGAISTDPSLVEWVTAEQDAYQLRTVADDGAGNPDTSTVYTDTGIVESSSTRSRWVDFDTNNRDEHVQLRRRVGGLWSDWASAAVSVSYTPPATPTVTVTATTEDIDGAPMPCVDVDVVNPAPGAGEPTVDENEVHVRVAAGGRRDGARTVGDDGAHIATVANSGSHRDRAVAHGVAYEYRVRARGNNGVSAWSAWG